LTRPIYIFAGGGTGGHLYPGLAVAEQLERLDRDARVVFACSNRPIDRRILDPLDCPVVPQPVRPIPRSPKGWIGFLKAWRRSVAQAGEMIADLKPVAVLGLGGFAAGPLVRRAARVGVRTAVLNPDAVPGKANRYLAKHADVIFSQFDFAREHFPPGVRQKVRCVGCPVRSSFLSAERPEALRHFDLRTDRKTLLVNGGSLGARLINDAVLGLKGDLAALSEAWQVLHVTGRDRYAEVGGAWQTAGIHTRGLPYCDRMDLAYAAADLVVGRCGASTAAELAATATPAVLMPYPFHKDQQQRLNAGPLVEAGAAILVADRADLAANTRALRSVLLPLLADADRLGRMRNCAAGIARPDAARAVAEWLLDASRDRVRSA